MERNLEMSEEEIRMINKAREFATKAHEGQVRHRGGIHDR